MTPAARIDIRPFSCPLTWVKTRIALDGIRVGEALEVLLSAGEPAENLPRSAEEEGHRVATREPWAAGGWRVVLVKGGGARPEGGSSWDGP